VRFFPRPLVAPYNRNRSSIERAAAAREVLDCWSTGKGTEGGTAAADAGAGQPEQASEAGQNPDHPRPRARRRPRGLPAEAAGEPRPPQRQEPCGPCFLRSPNPLVPQEDFFSLGEYRMRAGSNTEGETVLCFLVFWWWEDYSLFFCLWSDGVIA
jgi:hypothetical protein